MLGDVTHGLESTVGTGYSLVLDTGTFHGLTPEKRLAMGREVTAITSKHATVILDCFAPATVGPLPPGVHPGRRRGSVPRLGDHRRAPRGHRPGPIAKVLKFDELFSWLNRAPQPADD